MKRDSAEERIRNRLDRMARGVRRDEVARGVEQVLFLLLLFATILAYLDAFLHPPFLVLFPLLLFGLTLIFLAIYLLLARRWGRAPGPIALARRLDPMIPAFRGRLVAGMEEKETGSDRQWGYSISLAGEAAGRAADILDRLRDDAIAIRIGWPRGRRSLFIRVASCACLLALGGGFALHWPISLMPSFGRLVHPIALYRAERTWDLFVSPGDARWMKGDSLRIEVRSPGRASRLEPVLHLLPDGAREVRGSMEEEGTGAYDYPVGKVDRPFRYWVVEKRRRSPSYRIDLLEPPAVVEVAFRVIPPSYAGIPPRPVEEGSRILHALKGSKVRVSGSSSAPLDSASLDLSGDRRVLLDRDGGRRFSGIFPVSPPDTFRIVLVDSNGISSADGEPYVVKLIEDRPPEVRLVTPGRDIELGRDLEEDLRFRAMDDFGLLDLEVPFTILSRGGEARDEGMLDVAVFGSSRRKEEVDYHWDL